MVRRLRGLVLATCLAVLASALTLAVTPPAWAANPACASGMTAQQSLTATPSHGKVMYIDSGVTPKVDAAYVGYKIANTAASSAGNRTDIWATVENFAGGKVVPASTADKYQRIETLTFGTSSTVYFLLKAFGPSTLAQSHTLKVYDRRPDLSGATVLLACDFTFTKVAETLKSSANKITAITRSYTPTTPTLGGVVDINITTASTGRVGAGSSPDGALFWASPAGVSNWPTGALRLETTTVTIDCIGNTDLVLTDTLIASGTTLTNCVGSAPSSWTSTYRFRIIGPATCGLVPAPVAMISNGARYSHNDISGITNNMAVDLCNITTGSITVDLTSALKSGTSSSVTIAYTITMSTTSASPLEVDEAVFNYTTGMSLVAGSTKLGATTRTDPYPEASGSPPPYHFTGPFTISSGSNAVLTFDMTVPCSADQTTYNTSATGRVGDIVVGSTTSTVPISSTTTQTLNGACASSNNDGDTNLAPAVQTNAASSVTSSAATLNGYANASGNTGIEWRFSYSTDPNVAVNPSTTSWTSVTGTSNTGISANLTSLSASTVYYFKAQVRDAFGTVFDGGVLSFTTNAIQSTPTATTQPANPVASGRTGTTTLNGTINPNLTDITSITFVYCLSGTGCSSSGITSGTETAALTVADGAGGTTTLTLTGSGDTPVSFDVTSQTAGDTYFFKVRAYCTVNATYCPNGYVDGAVLSYKIGAPAITTDAPTGVAATTATLNGTLTGGSTVTWSFVYCASGAGCTAAAITSGTETSTSSATSPSNLAVSKDLTGLTAGTTYYYQAKAVDGSFIALGEIRSFTTLLITTSSLPSGVAGTTYSAGVVGIGGSAGYSWSTTSSLPTGVIFSSAGLFTGTPTTVGSYPIIVIMTDAASGQTTSRLLTIVIKGTVTYYGNTNSTGSDPTDSNSPYSLGDTVTVVGAGNLAKSGYSFNGWNTAADGSGTPYASGATFAMPSANVSLYAQWTGVTSDLAIIAPPVVLIDPRAGSVNLPTIGISGAANLLVCMTEVADASGTPLAVSPRLTVAERTSVANVTKAAITHGRSYAGALANVQTQLESLKLNATGSRLAPGLSRYVQVRVWSNDDPSASCSSGGASTVMQIRPYGLYRTKRQDINLG